MKRPRPPLVEPAALSLPVPTPSDAIVLFDGTDLSHWRAREGGPALWKLENGYMETGVGAGSILSRQRFGDVQLHLEWAAPASPSGDGQDRGNSGVIFMDQYEVQVLDSYQNHTYADGQAAAVYGQHPPLFNASLPPGQWQSYDIAFRRPRFDHNGVVVKPARITVIHNGVLVQEAVELVGPTSWLQAEPYRNHPDRLPLQLQDHRSPVRFRNIWVRELPEYSQPGPGVETVSRPEVTLAPDVLEHYVGDYRFVENDSLLVVSLEDGVLRGLFGERGPFDLIPRSRREFSLRWTAASLVFALEPSGHPISVVFFIGRQERQAKRVTQGR